MENGEVSDGANMRRNADCPCGSGRRYKHCCGDPKRQGVHGPVGSPSVEVAGDAPVKTKTTFVVLGCPRGGTSLLAGALHRAGIYMGSFETTQYEDPDFELPPPLAGEAVARLAPTIRSRNAGFEYWGWKIPDNIYYVSNVIHLLVNPVFLIIYRDPVAIARSSARHDGLDWDEQRQRLLDAAVTHTRKVRAFQQRLVNGFHVFQLESIHADPGAFVDRLAELLHPLPVSREDLLEFVDREGGYH